jgi:FAS-associated factor 2
MDDSDYPRAQRPPPRDTAPRIVPQRSDRIIWRPPFILSIFFTPINMLYRVVSSSLGLMAWIFPFLPRVFRSITNRSGSRAWGSTATGRRPLSSRDTAARFIREFGEEYGDHRLHFYENGYAQAYDEAKKDLKYLLIILLSPEHDDTNTFVQEVLLSQEFESFVNNPENNIILWAGNVQDSEAYQVSIGLNCTKFPFGALIVHTPQDSSTAMSTIARVTGLVPAATFISKLRNAMSEHSAPLEQVRTQRREQEAARTLREQQESAYERSLAQDRERMRLRREAQTQRDQEELAARLKAEAEEKEAQNLQQWKRWKLRSIAPEPGPDIKNATRLSIRMPSGDRIVRRFAPEATVEDLYTFVECYDILEAEKTAEEPPADYDHHYKFNLVSPMPRMVYDIASGGTVAERIGRSGNLIVESIDDDEDEDED